ncbi:hypothetical protein K432DRAFT_377950 [Lepidopterella palustris CBS 459.81]|uniref:Uncharacterized protein n=1 Tax=Lepidopterella palustris CBS 459.81 TaxID=1314670 RepID=A0A8E2EJS7_9PEZI|nr:hypothetical protein K432DRAFT_377950 [Lepidopterella palustris CBS 459.81]
MLSLGGYPSRGLTEAKISTLQFISSTSFTTSPSHARNGDSPPSHRISSDGSHCLPIVPSHPLSPVKSTPASSPLLPTSYSRILFETRTSAHLTCVQRFRSNTFLNKYNPIPAEADFRSSVMTQPPSLFPTDHISIHGLDYSLTAPDSEEWMLMRQ